MNMISSNYATIQMIFWLINAICGVGIIYSYFNYRTKMMRLPYATELVDLETRCKLKVEEIGRLQEEFKDYQKKEAQLSRFTADILESNKKIEKNNEELLSLSAEREKQETIRLKIYELQDLLDELKNEFSKKQNEKNELDQKLYGFRRDIDNHNAAIKELSSKISQSRIALEKLENNISKATIASNDLDGKISALKQDELILVKSVEQHSELLKHLNERDADLKIMIERRMQEISQLDELLKSRQDQIDKLQNTQIETDESVTKVLTRPYLDIHSKRQSTSEEVSLKYFEHCLQSDGLQFDQRLIYRFHTSLKITSHCPLVILSGISGTGKTLLAQSYANACGLHFLPMAVQPRWDSPQDLFGYYDFTKKQFAATELSRALMQMDPYNRNQWLNATISPQWIDDNLLMVLIDEMNIARVEHYFSELLSKLELRRNCSFNDNASRKKAEISLNNCILPATEQEVSLFVDYNTLFVGTLNEDETTLALSDKILDRANVIHFGKPDSLSTKKNVSSISKTKSMLSYETWKGWIKNESSIPKAQKSEIDKILHDFNSHMGQVGRPFGHRTYQAIYAYIANYPSHQSETSWKQALADQVEQKLLTRLRGVDLSSHHNAMSEIEALVWSLEDEKLSQRLSDAKESSYFEWK